MKAFKMIMKAVVSFLFSAILLCVVACSPEDEKTPEQKSEAKCKDEYTAYDMSRRFVKDMLVSPSTADFPYKSSAGVSILYEGDCKHSIYSYVDSQNSFGGMIRTKYYVQVQNVKGTDTWNLLDVKIQ